MVVGRRARRDVWSDPFVVGLASIALIALAIRVAAAFWYDATTPIGGDGVWYWANAGFVAHARGFFEPLASISAGHLVPSAGHPPLYPAYLSIVPLVGLHSLLSFRLWSTLPGTAAVVLVGLTARDVAGRRAGLVAAGSAAVFINLWARDVVLWSEGMFVFTVALTLYASYRFARQPGTGRAVLLGVAITAAALTRAEAVLLFPLLLVPLVWRAHGRSASARAGIGGAALAVAALLVAPWIVYNAGRFDHPVLISTGLGGLLASSNCPITYRGSGIGSWGGFCEHVPGFDARKDETANDLRLRKAGIRYARAHASRLPAVIGVRLLRTFGFYRPSTTTSGDLDLPISVRGWGGTVAVLQYWAMLVVGIVGVVTLARRRVPLLPMWAMLAIVVVITVVGYGTSRFRVAFDTCLTVLAGVGADAALSAWSARRRAREDQRESAPLPSLAPGNTR